MKGDFTRWTYNPGNHYSAVLIQQGRVNTDADSIEGVEIDQHMRQEALRDVVGSSGAPAENPGFQLFISDNSNSEDNLFIGAGHYYVDGILCENDQDVAFTEQADLPGQVLPDPSDDTLRFLAYLDVWERHITVIEDPDIREVALGGVDSTTRKRTVCGVRLFQVPEDTHSLSSLPEWEQLILPADSRLAARARPAENADHPCQIPPDAQFIGLQNQLYRVEIHRGGALGDATFKWDRDNGSFALPIEEFLDQQPADQLRVGNAGKSDLHSLTASDLLEITDDIRELNGEPGFLRHGVLEPTSGIITLDEPVTGLSLDHHPKVRRWSCSEEIIIAVDTFIALEHGVEISFDGNLFRTGDYWLIPARTATRNVEWPTEGEDPISLLPLGIKHHYARLALLDFSDGDFSVVADDRNIFPPLAQNSLQIEGIELAIDGQALLLNSMIQALTLARGLNIEFSAPLSEDVFNLEELANQSINPAIEVQLSLPEPYHSDEREFWGLEADEFFGYHAVTVASSISFDNNQRHRLQWRLNSSTGNWVRQVLSRLVVDRILCTLRIRGSSIWANGPDGEQVFLQGETFAHPNRQLGRALTGGIGQIGSDFYMSFWIISDEVELPFAFANITVNLNVVSGVVSRGGALVGGAIVILRRTSGFTSPDIGAPTQQTQSDTQGRFSFTASDGVYTINARFLSMTVEREGVIVRRRPSRVRPGNFVLGGTGRPDRPDGPDGSGRPGELTTSGTRRPGRAGTLSNLATSIPSRSDSSTGPGNLTITSIDRIGPASARRLEANGVTSVREFSLLPPARIVEILPNVSATTARSMRDNAVRLLNES